MDNIQKLKETLEKNKEYYIERLRDLLRLNTEEIGHGKLGGNEKNGQDYLMGLLREMGADRVEKGVLDEAAIKKSLELYDEGMPGHMLEDRYNVYATFKGNGGKSLLLTGHVDTVPVHNLSEWICDPYEAKIVGDRIYGRGASDMKGGLMASIMAVKLLQDAKIPLGGDVIINSVAEEESGGNGTICAIMAGESADAVIVCEPSDRKLIRAHTGFIFFQIDVEGIAVHTGNKWKGVNAINKAIKVIKALDELDHHWLLTCKPFVLLPPPNVEITIIDGGFNDNSVPDHCTVKNEVHFTPNQNYKDIIADYYRAIELCADGDEWLREHRPVVTMYQFGNSFEEEEKSPICGAVRQSFQEIAGEELEIDGFVCGADSRLWKNIGKMPTVNFGPGSIARAHGLNEYIKIDEYLEAILVYAQTILNWCK